MSSITRWEGSAFIFLCALGPDGVARMVRGQVLPRQAQSDREPGDGVEAVKVHALDDVLDRDPAKTCVGCQLPAGVAAVAPVLLFRGNRGQDRSGEVLRDNAGQALPY